MNKVYIVEEHTWDHHDNIAVFSTKEMAESFCNTTYVKTKHCRDDQWASDKRDSPSYYYYIADYDVDATS